MKTKYYLRGTILGLFFIPLVAAYLLPVSDLMQMMAEWRFFVPVLAGYFAALVVAALADRYLTRRGILATVLVLVGVFIAGMVVGCLLNLLLGGYALNPRFSFVNGVRSWFVKPAYWLTMIGVPSAVAVAVLHYLTNWLYRHWRARENRV